MLPLESVPNFSEGATARRSTRSAPRWREHARLLDVHSDADHNRSVFTLVGSRARAGRCAARGIAVATRADRPARARRRPPADRRRRRRADRPARARATSSRARGSGAGRSASGSAPSSGCRSSSTRRPSAGPAFYRRGGTAGLQQRLDAGELAPDFGPPRLHRAAGGVIVGARRPLIAFNVNLRGSLDVARADRGASCASGAAASRACARSASTCRAPGSSRSR